MFCFAQVVAAAEVHKLVAAQAVAVRAVFCSKQFI
jgi:hypothetical protein